jgi:hypothetical protein
MNRQGDGLPRAATAAVLALAVAWLGVGCTHQPRSGERSSSGSTRSVHRTGPVVWEVPKTIPLAYLSGRGASPSARQRGILLSSHWPAPDGSIVDRTPDGVVAWPDPLRISDWRMPLRLRLATQASPIRVEVRVFDGTVDSSGVPKGQGQLLDCPPGAAGNTTCSYAPSDGGVEVVLVPNRTDRASMLLVLWAEWYIPVGKRAAAARSNPVIGASWGFRLAAGPRHKRNP